MVHPLLDGPGNHRDARVSGYACRHPDMHPSCVHSHAKEGTYGGSRGSPQGDARLSDEAWVDAQHVHVGVGVGWDLDEAVGEHNIHGPRDSMKREASFRDHPEFVVGA